MLSTFSQKVTTFPLANSSRKNRARLGRPQLDRGGNRVFPLSAASRPDQTGEPVAPPSMTGPVALLRSQNPRNEIAPLS